MHNCSINKKSTIALGLMNGVLQNGKSFVLSSDNNCPRATIKIALTLAASHYLQLKRSLAVLEMNLCILSIKNALVVIKTIQKLHKSARHAQSVPISSKWRWCAAHLLIVN